MARYTAAVCKLCRREGEKLFLKGSRCMTAKCAYERRPYFPGQHGREGQFRRGRASDYLLQLREKQKARRIYGVFEHQFRNYFIKSTKMQGLTGVNLLVLLESRIDNVIYRLGFADSRSQARQLVSHGHFLVNNRKINVPSALVKPKDTISVKPESKRCTYFQDLGDDLSINRLPRWLSLNNIDLIGQVITLPTREDIDVSLNEQLIVEYYSR